MFFVFMFFLGSIFCDNFEPDLTMRVPIDLASGRLNLPLDLSNSVLEDQLNLNPIYISGNAINGCNSKWYFNQIAYLKCPCRGEIYLYDPQLGQIYLDSDDGINYTVSQTKFKKKQSVSANQLIYKKIKAKFVDGSFIFIYPDKRILHFRHLKHGTHVLLLQEMPDKKCYTYKTDGLELKEILVSNRKGANKKKLVYQTDYFDNNKQNKKNRSRLYLSGPEVLFFLFGQERVGRTKTHVFDKKPYLLNKIFGSFAHYQMTYDRYRGNGSFQLALLERKGMAPFEIGYHQNRALDFLGEKHYVLSSDFFQLDKVRKISYLDQKRYYFDYIKSENGSRTVIYGPEEKKEEHFFNNDGFLEKIHVFVAEDKYYQIQFRYEIRDDVFLLAEKSVINESNEHVYSIKYEYNEDLLLSCKTICGNISGQGNSYSENKTQYFYDSYERLIEKIDPNGLSHNLSYVGSTNLIERVLYLDSQGQILKRIFYEYNDDFQKTGEIEDDGISENKDDLSAVSFRGIKKITPHSEPFYVERPTKIEFGFYDFEKGGFRALKKQEFSYYNHIEPYSIKTYNGNDHLMHEKTYKFDSFGQKVFMRDERGNEYSYRYDKLHRLIYEADHSRKVHTNYRYDLFGQMIEKTLTLEDGQLQIEKFEYDDCGRIISKTDSFDVTSYFGYDRLDRKIYESLEYDNQKLLVQREFDLKGNIISEKDSLSALVKTEYTLFNKPFLRSYSDGTCERYLYDVCGQLISYSDRLNIRTDFEYDLFSRVIRQEKFDANGISFLTKQYLYSAFNLIEKREGDSLKTYTFDAANRLVSKHHDGVSTKYFYDDNNQLQAKECAGIREVNVQDQFSRIVEKKVMDREQNIFRHQSFVYDSCDRIVQKTIHGKNKNVNEFFKFDSQSRLIEKVDNYGDRCRVYYKKNGLQRETHYPDQTQVVEKFSPFKKLIERSLISKDGRLLQKRSMSFDLKGNKMCELDFRISSNGTELERTTYEYDQFLSLCRIVGPYKNVSYEYFPNGQLRCVKKADGVCLNYELDSRGLISRQYSSDNSVDYQVEYDSQLRLVRAIDKNNGCSVNRTFDQTGCLKTESYNEIDVSFEYDKLKRVKKIYLPDKSSIEYDFNPYYLNEICRFSVDNTLMYRHVYDSYDTTGKLRKESLIGGLGQVFYDYDLLERVRSIKSAYHHFETIELNEANQVKTMRHDSQRVSFDYDALRQMTTCRDQNLNFDSCYHRDDLNLSVSLDSCSRIKGSAGREYTYDAKDRLIEVKTKTCLIKYAYDYFDRRLNKQVFDLSGNCISKEPYFYWDLNEIGSLKGKKIDQLRVLGVAKEGDIAGAVALELKGHVYAPLHDLMGSIRTIVAIDDKAVLERYYFDEFGRGVFDEALSPWLYSSKRVDRDAGLVFYSRRYFDPTLVRFITPDPMAMRGVNNPFIFSFNNPLSFYDAWGLENKESGPSIFMQIMDLMTSKEAISQTIFLASLENTGYQGLMGRDPSMQLKTIGSGSSLDRAKVFYINGILTTQDQAHETATTIAKNLSHPVTCVYNTSRGIKEDLSRLVLNKTNMYEMPIVRGLRDELQKAINQGSNRVYLFAHSEGGVIAKNALSTMRKEYRNKIDVFTFGSPSIIHNGYARNVVNYYASKDATIALSCISLALSNLFQGKYNIEYLDSSKEQIIDHYIMGSTYRNKLDNLASNISLNYGK